MRKRTLLIAGCLALSGIVAAAVTAGAASTITVTVKNGRGLRLYDAQVSAEPCLGNRCGGRTNGNGEIGVDALAGTAVAERVDPGRNDSCPTGQTRKLLIATDPNLEIKIPSLLPHAPKSSGISHSERVLLGLINKERRRLGRKQLEASKALSDSADRWAQWFNDHQRGSIANGHRKLCDVQTRIEDSGWPGRFGIGENLAATTKGPRGVFNGNGRTTGWRHHRGHYLVMVNGKRRAAGVGHSGKVWVLDVTNACPKSSRYRKRCRMTGDYGIRHP